MTQSSPLTTDRSGELKVQLEELWVTPGSLIIKVSVWAADASWRQKRYASMALADIPEEVLAELTAYLIDQHDHEVIEDIPLF